MFRKVLLGTACAVLLLAVAVDKVSAQQVPNADGVSFPGGTSVTSTLQYGFNGASWDRIPGNTTNGLKVQIGSGSFNPTTGVPSDGSNQQSLFTTSFGMVFNGTTWDRVRSAGANLGAASTGTISVNINEGFTSALNVTIATTIKSGAARLYKISVVTAGAVGQVCDTATACAAANVIGTIPATVGVYDFNWPVLTGIRIEPGAAQVVAVSYQ